MKISQLSPETLTEAKNARQVFLMVAELHKMGYEGLRVTPYLSPSGCYWRCCIVPASMTHPAHGARLADDVVYESLPKYSSADEDNYFGWRNMKPKAPLILARRFIVEFPKFAEQGHHPDPAYVRWFATMLELTAPIGVISAYGDWEPPVGRMINEFCEDGVVVPLPPVWASRLKASKLFSQHPASMRFLSVKEFSVREIMEAKFPELDGGCNLERSRMRRAID